MANFLVAGGHERIAHISGWQGSSTGRDRSRGFTADGLADHGLGAFGEEDGMYCQDTASPTSRAGCSAGPSAPTLCLSATITWHSP